MENVTFSSQFIEILDAICDKVGIAIDWSADNIAPYLQTFAEKFIAYQTTLNTFYIIVGAILFLGGVIGICVSFNKMLKNPLKYFHPSKYFHCYDLYDLTANGIVWLIFIIICFFASIFGFIVLAENIKPFIGWLTFPELQMFEYIQKMIK